MSFGQDLPSGDACSCGVACLELTATAAVLLLIVKLWVRGWDLEMPGMARFPAVPGCLRLHLRKTSVSGGDQNGAGQGGS